LTDDPSFEALLDRALALARQGDTAGALDRLETLISHRPDCAEAHFHRGNLLATLGRYREAAAGFEAALGLAPHHTGAEINLGNALQILGRAEEALAHFDAVSRVRPGLAPVWFNRGNALKDMGRHEEAIASYDHALAVDPSLVQALINKGSSLERLSRNEDAIACYLAALALKPDHAVACRNLGGAYFESRRYEQARTYYRRALELDPDQDYLRGALHHTNMSLAAWESYAADAAAIIAGVRAHERVVHPFIFLGLSESPADQRTAAEIWCRDRYPAAERRLWSGERYDHERIRLAYISADFHDHPMAYLMSGLFECHDRTRFEVLAFSFGPPSTGPQRRRFEAAFDRFLDVRGKSDGEIAELLRRHEVDIAIDRKGFTRGARPGIFALRPAPVQVSLVAYTGTMAAPYIDYLIADPTVVPEADRAHYSEEIVYLPESYIPNDWKRPIAAAVPGREEMGLPEDGFVFAAFVNPWKITPRIFATWMRLLAATDGSVLWLIEHSEATSRNLRSAAAAAGIAPERLVFARHIANPAHLARHRLADLSLDTLPYGAHTTASDSLWAGVPIVTCLGTTFAGRVTASMLKAVGLPELIAADLEGYVALALGLAREPGRLGEIRRKLAANLETHPLFDTGLYCRRLEAAYERMWLRSRHGKPPEGFSVPAE
jgi:predicted O-linked N-acetylglucosamine transferase (SPINDLY family)